MASPRVSVIIPAYRAADHIDGAVGSALRQTLAELEVIVVDDASPDGTAARVEALAARDARVRLVRAERNGGPARARNLGIAVADGAWLALLDSDDAFLPGRVERLLEVAAVTGADLVADDLELADGETGVVLRTALPREARALEILDAATFVRRNQFGQQSFTYGYLKPMIRRSFLERTGIRYREDVRIGEDYQLYLDCLLEGARFAVVREAYYTYRLMRGSISRRLEVTDAARLEELNRALLAGRAALPSDLCRALEERARCLEGVVGHGRFVDLVKSGRPAHALAFLARRPDLLPLVLTSVREGVLKRLGLMRFHGMSA